MLLELKYIQNHTIFKKTQNNNNNPPPPKKGMQCVDNTVLNKIAFGGYFIRNNMFKSLHTLFQLYNDILSS